MELALMSEQRVSGKIDTKVHSSMLGCSIPLHQVTVISPQPPATNSTNRKNEENMTEQRDWTQDVHSPGLFSCWQNENCSHSHIQKTSISTSCKALKQPYSHTMGWLRCRISFSLLHSAITCLQGAHSTPGYPVGTTQFLDCHHGSNLLELWFILVLFSFFSFKISVL